MRESLDAFILEESYHPAPFMKRLGAYIIDCLLCGICIFLICGIVIAALSMIYSGHDSYDTITIILIIIAAIFLFVLFITIPALYEAYYTSMPEQATPGKRLFNIQVINIDHSPITFWQGIGRHFAKYISGHILCYIGFLMALWEPQKQSLHDIMLKTMVVNKLK